ncbi:LamG-like jellyroll fold domain-containing protein [Dokdonia sp.]|uniref:LamG-like jellyroll fold domain-containing protein n=1 Tax=Dokdonia sp. TaxID=2024995 RepID=UPI003262EAF1
MIPDYNNILYGETNREVCDIFLPVSDTPTGVVIEFHGGGFISGNKTNTYNETTKQDFIEALLDNKIAYITANYDLMETVVERKGIISSLESSLKLIKYLENNLGAYNLDRDKFILKGQSSGAGISMWIGYQDNNILAISIAQPQATYDLLKWDDVFSVYGYNVKLDYQTNELSKISTDRFYAVTSFKEIEDVNFTSYRESVDMLQFIETNGGVPTWLLSNASTFETQLTSNTLLDINHNSYHGKTILDALNSKKTEVIAYLTSGLDYTDPTEEDELSFIIRKINGDKKQVDFLTNLTAAYQFNDNFSDSIGANNAAKFGIVKFVNGLVGKTAEFDGSTGHLIIPPTDDFTFTDGTQDLPFHISYLTKINTLDDQFFISRRGRTGENKLEWSINISNGYLYIMCRLGDNTGRIQAKVNNPLIIGEWGQLDFGYDGSKDASGLKIYKNGVLLPSENIEVGNYTGMDNTGAETYIGRDEWTNGLFLNGQMDTIKIWKNRELKEQEVIALYNKQLAGVDVLS